MLACLVAFNVASLLRWRGRREVTNGELFVALLVDVGMLTAQLYLSGGATNPFIFLYLLQVILGAVLLRAWSHLDHRRRHRGLLRRPGRRSSGRWRCRSTTTRGLASPYILGMLICFALNAALLVIFITRISRNLRARDAHLADLRQRAAEEEHIVRMGLLASGAAHELGTPLATLSVILGDWQRMPPFTADPELLQEIERDAGPGRSAARPSSAASCCRPARRAANRRRRPRSAPSSTTWSTSGAPRAGRRRFAYENRFGARPAHRLRFGAEADDLQRARQRAGSLAAAGSAWTAARDDDALMLTVTDARPRLRARDAGAARQALPVEQGPAGRRPGAVPGRQRGAHAGRQRRGAQSRRKAARP